MNRIHGKIFTWTYKGEVYIRKDVEGAPKKKITSLEDLTNIKKGDVSIDPPLPKNTNLSEPTTQSPIENRSPEILTANDVTNTPNTREERTADVIQAMAALNI